MYIEFFRNNGANVKCHVKSAMMEMLNTFLEILFKLEDTMVLMQSMVEYFNV